MGNSCCSDQKRAQERNVLPKQSKNPKRTAKRKKELKKKVKKG